MVSVGRVPLAGMWSWLFETHRVMGLDWNYLVVLGFLGQVVFTLRFAIQWIASERKRRSVIPLAFWHLSIVGSAILVVYFALRHEPVGLAGNLFGSIVYFRNLHLVRNRTDDSSPAGSP